MSRNRQAPDDSPGLAGHGAGSTAPPASSTPSHELLEHTGEVHLRIRGATLADIFIEGGRALGRLCAPDRGTGIGGWHRIEISAPDRAALLVAWLNELIFFAEQQRCAPNDFAVDEISRTHLRARVRGVPLDVGPSLVKAATMHGLRLEEVDGTLEAEVILDV
jgi:SHS2 domain-containing protein